MHRGYGRVGTSSSRGRLDLVACPSDSGGYPQLPLIECGTHAVIDALFDGSAVSELALAHRALSRPRPGMLLLAGRTFPRHELWGSTAATGADLAWRIKKSQVFWPGEQLPAGSFLSMMATPAVNVRHGQARPPAGRGGWLVARRVRRCRRAGGVATRTMSLRRAGCDGRIQSTSSSRQSSPHTTSDG